MLLGREWTMLFVGGLTAYKLSPDVEEKTLYKSAQVCTQAIASLYAAYEVSQVCISRFREAAPEVLHKLRQVL